MRGGVLHILRGLEIGGLERAALRLACRDCPARGVSHLFLFDTPFRPNGSDLEPEGIPWTFLPRRRGVDARLVRAIARYARAHGLGIVHAHNGTAAVYAALAKYAAWPHRLRVIATIHAFPSEKALTRQLMRGALARCDLVVAVSYELSERLRRNKWLASCITIPNGIELDRFRSGRPLRDWREQLGLGREAVIVGYLARFDPVKRHVDLLDAARRLTTGRFGNVQFILAGEGPLRPAITASASGLTNVHVLGPVHDVVNLLQSIDVFTLCSVDEGAPLALLEAMATGLPSVCTAVGDVPRMVSAGTDRRAAILISPCQPGALAGALAYLANKPLERARLGTNALKLATAMSFDAEWAAYSRLYESLDSDEIDAASR